MSWTGSASFFIFCSYIIMKAIEVALQIIEELKKKGIREVRQREIAKEIVKRKQVSFTTAYKVINQLVERGVIKKVAGRRDNIIILC